MEGGDVFRLGLPFIVKDRAEILRNSLIRENTLLKNSRSINAVSAIDGQVALVECSIMHGTRSHSIADVDALAIGREGHFNSTLTTQAGRCSFLARSYREVSYLRRQMP